MNKIIINTLIFFLLSSKAFAGKGIVIVLQAPLLSEGSFSSYPVSHIRKGEEIFIHDKHFTSKRSKNEKEDNESLQHNKEISNQDGFFQTIDSNGGPAYVEKKYIKLIYNDERELQSSINPFLHDPTDYRLEEPLPKNYPLKNDQFYSAGAYMAFGPNRKINYNYPTQLSKETFSSRVGIEMFYSRKVSYDIYDRFHFGGMGHIYTYEGVFELSDQSKVTETGGEIGMGPFLSYTFYRSSNWKIIMTGGLTLNYMRHLVSQSKDTDIKEERFFTGLSLTPKIKAYAVRKHFLPTIDFMAGFDLTTNLPIGLSSQTEIQIPEFWQSRSSQDKVAIPFSGIWSFILGINASY